MAIDMKWSELKCNRCHRGYCYGGPEELEQQCISRKIHVFTVWSEGKTMFSLVPGKISEVKKDFKKYGLSLLGDKPKFQYQIKADCLQCAMNVWDRIRGYNSEKRDCVSFFCNQ